MTTPDDTQADDLDMIGDDENPAHIPQINPLKGLVDDDDPASENSPASDADAPAPG